MTEQENRNATEMIRVTPEVHERVKATCREGETLSGAIHRAVDALEREGESGTIDVDALVEVLEAANEPDQTLQVSDLVAELETLGAD